MVEVRSSSAVSHGSFFDRPAIFVTTHTPGYIAGAAQCTLAYLQALTQLHRGAVTYVGPQRGGSCPPLNLRESVFVAPRKWWEKALGLATLSHIDRTTPVAQEFLRTLGDRRAVVYINGEHAGKVVRTAKELGLTAIFMPHNYPAEYLDAESRGFNPLGAAYHRIAVRNALTGFRHADLCLFLTEHDAHSYQRGAGQHCAASRYIAGSYFGYRQEAPREISPHTPHAFTVLLNTNMGARQNEEGVLFFLKQVWSQVAPERGWRLVLAGGFPGPAICGAAERLHGVTIVRDPKPEEMEGVFAGSSVCVAASLRGSGIKLRVGEAIRRGLPVISSEHCVTGYERISTDVLRVFRSPDEALRHLENLCSEPREFLRSRCFDEYDRELSFDAGYRKMLGIAAFFEQT
jgi:hypothetical protein